MKRLSNAFSYIFSDNEWFNKVLVGGFYFLLIPFGFGIIMLNGYFIAFLKRCGNGEKEMPYWRNFRSIFISGLRKSWLSLSFIALIYCTVFISRAEFTLPSAILTLTCILTSNSLYIAQTFDLFSLIVSIVLLVIVISVGWMWIVVGWPLLIFLALLVQMHLFTDIKRRETVFN